MLHDADGARIRLRRFCEVEEKEVPYEHIVKGFEVSPGRYVTVTPEELEAVDPKATRSIDIQDFVDLSEIDPIYYDATYYLGPDGGAAKAYGLLLEAMRDAGKVAVARVVLRTRQHLCAVRPMGETLAMSTMNHADELVPLAELGIEAPGKPAARELEMARELIASLTTRFQPERYPDEYREKVLALIDHKAAGEEVVSAPPEKLAPVVNLADALRASLAAAQRRGDGAGGAAAASRRAAPAPSRGERRHRVAAAARTASAPRKAAAPKPAARRKKGHA
jgi:DNA end-binding protein Ku